MDIKAVKMYDNGFMTQSFAFGGEEGVENFDSKIKYRSSLQNYLIDTGEEIILVDTGMPKETPEIPKNDDAPLYMGEKIMDYVSAFEKLGYNKEDVTKILITHKHDDHTGEIRNFPNAKVYISKTEAEEMNLVEENIIPVEFNDGPYHNFQNSEKITENLYLIEAKGHTTGNSIVILEDGQKYYMFQVMSHILMRHYMKTNYP